MNVAAVRVMDARFPSTCGRCASPIRKGDAIRYVKGMQANHEVCGNPTVFTSQAAYRRPRYSTWAARCTHEDYPCCGCDQ